MLKVRKILYLSNDADQTDKLALKLSLPVNSRILWPTLSMVSVIRRKEQNE
jgi:hypothetical protein